MRPLPFRYALPLLLLAGCASLDPPKSGVEAMGPPRPAAATDGVSSYGLFLAGEAALNDGHTAEAGQWFDAALAQPGADVLVGEKAFTAALLAGDVAKAKALAPTDPATSESTRRMARLVEAVEAMAAGKGKVAHALLTSDAIAFPHQSAAALLAPWAAAEAGDVENSLVRPQVRGDRIVDYFGLLGQGRLFERARRYDEAETDFKASTAADATSEMAVLAYGGFLERRGRRLDAAALYNTALASDADDTLLLAAKARAEAGKPAPPQPSLREGAAQSLLAPAATMMAAKQSQIALAYLRLVLRLDPRRDDAWVMVGDLLQAGGDTDSARDAYSRPRPGSPDFDGAQAKLAWSYETAGDHDTALRLARAAAISGGADARLTLADLLRANQQYAEAAGLLSQLIKERPTPDWRLYYARGVSYQQLDRWPEAQSDLQAALAQRPDEPELLNYLGYSWIDRGERLPEALAMVEKAVAGNPQSGEMMDSLGWAHYRLGHYKIAVEKLEQAVSIEAGDPEINNHLGDAYWKAGRRDEAVFQWRRVLVLKPDAKVRADAEAKLASGLGPDGRPPKIAGK